MRKRPAFSKPTLFQILTLLFACVAVFLIFNLGRKWLTWQEARSHKLEVAQQVEAARARVNELEQQLREAQSDVYVEKTFREDFGGVKENEGSAYLEYEAKPADAALPSAPAEKPYNAPPHWLDWARQFLQP